MKELVKVNPGQGQVFIYGLVCPDTNTIVYVGQANTTLACRLTNHCSASSLKAGPNKPFLDWKRGLIERGMKPGIVLLERVRRTRADNAERKWTRHFQGLGPIFNIRNTLPVSHLHGHDLHVLNSLKERFNLSVLSISVRTRINMPAIANLINGRYTTKENADTIATYLFSLKRQAQCSQ